MADDQTGPGADVDRLDPEEIQRLKEIENKIEEAERDDPAIVKEMEKELEEWEEGLGHPPPA